MKEIKYRQCINGEFSYWGFFKESDDDSFWKGPITTIDLKTKEPYPSEVYIEINDKHGKEIFVGDRIKAKVEHNPPYVWVEGIVFYDDGEYCIEQEDDYFPVCSFHIIDRNTIEIIGTVYDRLECERCGKKDESVEHTVDPYELEINGETVWINLCKDCHTQKAEDV